MNRLPSSSDEITKRPTLKTKITGFFSIFGIGFILVSHGLVMTFMYKRFICPYFMLLMKH